MVNKWQFAAALLALLLLSCNGEEPLGLDFFTATTIEVSNGDLGAGRVLLEGRSIIDSQTDENWDYGFYFSSDSIDVATEQASAVLSLGSEVTPGFEMPSPNLERGTTYHFRAFVKDGERTALGRIISFEFDFSLEVSPVDAVRRNDSLTMSMSVTNLDSSQVNDYGYTLAITEAGDVVETVGEFSLGQELPENFTVFFPYFNTEYKITPYLDGDQRYDGTPFNIAVSDGWVKIASLPNASQRSNAIVIGQTAYVGGGCDSGGNEGCASFNSLNVRSIEFPSGQSPADFGWSTPTIIGSPWPNLREGFLFSYNDQPYGMLGRRVSPSSSTPYAQLKSLTSNDLSFDLPDSLRLEHPTGFVIGDRLYFGTGVNPLEGTATDSFYRLNLSTLDTIVAIAPLPVRFNNEDDSFNRIDAISFEADGRYYVGTGRFSPSIYNDFYRFDLESESWTFAGRIPAAARSGASSFSINGKAYVGLGQGRNEDFYRDLWEYLPTDMSFRVRQSLPESAVPRANAISFSLNGYGCVCGGRPPREIGQSVSSSLRDCWLYIPSQID